MDTKKFTLLVAALTAVICALTVVYNFASMPAYGNEQASAVPLYTSAYSQGSSGSLTQSSSTASAPTSSAMVNAAPPADSASEPASTYAATKASSTTRASTRRAAASSSKAKATTANPVNLNTATLAQLETVPYIGATKAQAIITYRSAHGPFKSINDLDSVKGFGAKMIAKVSPYLITA